LSRNTTDLLGSRAKCSARGGHSFIAEPFLDSTSDFTKIAFATVALPRSWNTGA
jgi:hypothetical protein